MADLFDELDAIAGAGGTIDELARRAEAALADPAVVAAEVREPEALFSGAERRWDALVERTRQAWLRYRGGSGRPLGSHGEAPDARAPELFATPTYLEKAGIYRPSELRERAAVDEPWAAREALRLSMILLAVEALIARLDDGSIEPAAWSGAIEQIVRRFGRMTIAR